MDAERAGDFLVTAATLMQIKSRMLLPKNESANEEILEQDEADPRTELVNRLLEYQKIQEAAQSLREKREERADLFARVAPNAADFDAENAESLLLAEVSSFDLLAALRRVLKRVEERPVALVRREAWSLADRLRDLQGRLNNAEEALSFAALCDDCQSRLEVVITFLAILELIRRGKIGVRQSANFEEIWLETA